MKNRKSGFAVTAPSCACWLKNLEDEIEAAMRRPKETLKLLVSLAARIVRDRKVDALRRSFEALNEGSCKCFVDRLQFGIPLRPLFLPAVWKIKADRLSEQLRGILSASIDFVRSVIAVDYLPALVQPHEIRGALLGATRRYLDHRRSKERKERVAAKSVLRGCRCDMFDAVAA